MAMYINTNIASLNAQANLANSQSTLATDIQRLSSGLRINSAADDAAGMAIATRMGSQISGQNQAIRNANDGISLSQTAQGAMQSIVANLQTMRSLAVQSANATYSTSDRASMNAEVQQLKAEIDRVAASTQFNGVNLLDGSFTAQNFQVGANNTANDSIQVTSIANMHTTQLGSAGSSNAANVAGTATTAALNAGDLTLNGFQVGASQIGSAPGQSAASAYSVAQAINAVSPNSGVSATANATTLSGSSGPTVYTAVAANTFSINGVNVGAIVAGSSAAGQGANVAAAINLISAQTGVTASSNAATGALTLTATDGRDINIALNNSGTIGAVGTAGSALNNASVLASQLGLATSQIGTQAVAAVSGATATAGGGTIVAGAAPVATAGTIAAGTFSANGVSVGAITLNAFTAATAGATQTAETAVVLGASQGVETAGAAGTQIAASTASAFTLAGTYSGTVHNLVVNGTALGDLTFVGNATTDGTTLVNAINSKLSLSGGAQATSAAGVISTGTTALTFSIGGVAQTSALATSDKSTLATATGLSSAQLGTQAYANASFTVPNGATGSISNLQVSVNGGASVSVATVNLTGNQATDEAALISAINTAAGAGTVVSTDTAGAIGIGAVGPVKFSIGGLAATSSAATASQTALTAQTGLSSSQLGTQATATSTFTVPSGATGTVSNLTVTVGATTTTVGSVTLTGNQATDEAALISAINTAAGRTVVQSTGTAGVVGVVSNATFGIGGTSQNSTTAATDLSTLTAQTGLSASALGARAYGGAVGNGIAIAAAISTALASASGGAVVNGTAAANATTGIVTITSGTSATTLAMLGTAADAATAATNQTTLSTNTGFTATQLGNQAVDAAAMATHGTVSLTSTSTIVIGGAATASAGLTAGSTAATVSSTVNSIASMDVLTATHASTAIASIDSAINTVNSAAGQMGAIQNRFQSVVSNLQTTVQNLTAAQSRIQDTDFAATTASLTQAQILQQAGTAMLAQANALPNAVLTLLK